MVRVIITGAGAGAGAAPAVGQRTGTSRGTEAEEEEEEEEEEESAVSSAIIAVTRNPSTAAAWPTPRTAPHKASPLVNGIPAVLRQQQIILFRPTLKTPAGAIRPWLRVLGLGSIV